MYKSIKFLVAVVITLKSGVSVCFTSPGKEFQLKPRVVELFGSVQSYTLIDDLNNAYGVFIADQIAAFHKAEGCVQTK